MAPPDPRQSILGRLFRRQPAEPDPAATVTPEPDKPTKRKPRYRYVPPVWDGQGPVPAPFHTGQPSRPGRSRPKTRKAEFIDRSESDRIKKDQEFQRRFKGERAQATALDAMNDAEAVRQALKDQHIERLRGLGDTLHRLTATSRPVPPEAGQDINQRFADAFARFDREMEEVGQQLKRTLDLAEQLDIRERTVGPKLPKRITMEPQKRITYKPSPPFDFMDAATKPMPPGPPRAPVTPRTVLDHPFNDAATQPEAPKRSSEPAFNDAVTAPDPVKVWLNTFERAAPPQPERPSISPDL